MKFFSTTQRLYESINKKQIVKKENQTGDADSECLLATTTRPKKSLIKLVKKNISLISTQYQHI